MNQTQKTKAKIGILAACACAICYTAFSPVIASIAAAFPETDISLVQMVMTLPSLMFIVFSPLAGKLMAWFRKKTLLLVSLCLYLFGGVFPFFFHGSIWMILAGSLLIGCGGGILTPVTNALICDCFPIEERAPVMGLSATFAALGALLFIFVSGQLVSAAGWTSCFLSFLLVIPVIAAVLVCLPAGAPERAQRDRRGGFEMNPYVACLFLLGFLFFTLQNAFNTNSSLYLAEAGIGDAGTASLVTMGNTLGGILGGAVFGFAVSRCRDQIGSVSFALACAGFLLAGALQLRFPLLLGGALVGVAFAFYNAAGTFLLSKYLRPENNSFTVSIYMAVINLGGALSPVIVNTLSRVLGGRVVSRYLFCGAAMALCTLISVAVNRRHSADG